MFGLEHGENKLWYFQATSRTIQKNHVDDVRVLIPAPDKAAAEKMAASLCGGKDYHGTIKELSKEQLFGE